MNYTRLFSLFSVLLFHISVLAQEMLNYDSLLSVSASKLYESGNVHLKQNHTDTAMGYYIVLAGKYNKRMNNSDKYLCATACVVAGEIYFQKENYLQAFDLYLKGIMICEDNKFDSLRARFYKNIGNIYSVFDDNVLAIDCYKKGLNFARKNHLTEIEIKILLNLAGICAIENQVKEAEKYYREMMIFAPKDSLVEYFGHLVNALIHTASSRHKEAASSFQAAISYAKHVGLEPKYIASAYTELAYLYQKEGKQDSALYYYEQNARFCQEHNLMYVQRTNLKALAKLYSNKANKKKADFYINQYFFLTDSALSTEEFKKIKNTQVVYELDKNYKKITTLTYEKEQKEIKIRQQRTVFWITLGCLLVFISMLLVLYIQKRKLHHAYKNLFQRNNEILQSEHLHKELRTKYEHLKNKFKNEAEAYEEETSDKIKSYSPNKISDEQRGAILHNITHIMEETELFCNSDFSLEQLASLIGSNSRYVSQIINDTYNKNFRTFVNEYRIRKVCTRLMNTAEYGNYTIKAIGESVGYKSYANFTDTFKKVTGITPSIYQKLTKE